MVRKKTGFALTCGAKYKLQKVAQMPMPKGVSRCRLEKEKRNNKKLARLPATKTFWFFECQTRFEFRSRKVRQGLRRVSRDCRVSIHYFECPLAKRHCASGKALTCEAE